MSGDQVWQEVSAKLAARTKTMATAVALSSLTPPIARRCGLPYLSLKSVAQPQGYTLLFGITSNVEYAFRRTPAYHGSPERGPLP